MINEDIVIGGLIGILGTILGVVIQHILSSKKEEKVHKSDFLRTLLDFNRALIKLLSFVHFYDHKEQRNPINARELDILNSNLSNFYHEFLVSVHLINLFTKESKLNKLIKETLNYDTIFEKDFENFERFVKGVSQDAELKEKMAESIKIYLQKIDNLKTFLMEK